MLLLLFDMVVIVVVVFVAAGISYWLEFAHAQHILCWTITAHASSQGKSELWTGIYDPQLVYK